MCLAINRRNGMRDLNIKCDALSSVMHFKARTWDQAIYYCEVKYHATI
jgi:hypothetical protein